MDGGIDDGLFDGDADKRTVGRQLFGPGLIAVYQYIVLPLPERIPRVADADRYVIVEVFDAEIPRKTDGIGGKGLALVCGLARPAAGKRQQQKH